MLIRNPLRTLVRIPRLPSEDLLSDLVLVAGKLDQQGLPGCSLMGELNVLDQRLCASGAVRIEFVDG